MKPPFFTSLIASVAILTTPLWAQSGPLNPAAKRQRLLNTYSQSSTKIANKLNKLILGHGTDILTLARALKEVGGQERTFWFMHIRNFMEEFPEYSAIRIVNARGLEEMKLINKKGVEVYHDVSRKAFFIETINSQPGEVFVSPLQRSEYTNSPMIRIATLMQGLGNMDRSILVFDWEVEESIYQLLDQVAIRRDGSLVLAPHKLEQPLTPKDLVAGAHTILINRQGVIVYHPDRARILKEDLDETISIKLKAIALKMEEMATGYGDYSLRGQKLYLAYAPFEQMNWSVGVVLPAQSLDTAKNNQATTPSPSPISIADQLQTATPAPPAIASPTAPPSPVAPAPVRAISHTVAAKTYPDISDTTRKILDGSLRAAPLKSFQATMFLTITPPQDDPYEYQVRYAGEVIKGGPKGPEYQNFFAQNTDTVLTFSDLGEAVYRNVRVDVLAPEILRRSRRTYNGRTTIISYPTAEIIKMESRDLAEFNRIIQDRLRHIVRDYGTMDISRFTADTMDMKPGQYGIVYDIKMRLKKSFMLEGMEFYRVNMVIDGRSFMPLAIKWHDQYDRQLVNIRFEEVSIDTDIDDNQFITPHMPDMTVKQYRAWQQEMAQKEEVRTLTEKTKIKFTYPEVKDRVEDEISRRGKMVLANLVLGVKTYLRYSDYNAISTLVKQNIQVKNIAYISVVDAANRRVIADFGPSETLSGDIRTDELTASVQVSGRTIATVRVGIEYQDLDSWLHDRELLTIRELEELKAAESASDSTVVEDISVSILNLARNLVSAERSDSTMVNSIDSTSLDSTVVVAPADSTNVQ